jgi:hypothetical protein
MCSTVAVTFHRLDSMNPLSPFRENWRYTRNRRHQRHGGRRKRPADGLATASARHAGMHQRAGIAIAILGCRPCSGPAQSGREHRADRLFRGRSGLQRRSWAVLNPAGSRRVNALKSITCWRSATLSRNPPATISARRMEETAEPYLAWRLRCRAINLADQIPQDPLGVPTLLVWQAVEVGASSARSAGNAGGKA